MNWLKIIVFLALITPVQTQTQAAQSIEPVDFFPDSFYMPDEIFIQTTTQEAPHGTTTEPPTSLQSATYIASVSQVQPETVQPETVQPGFIPWNAELKDVLIIAMFAAFVIIGKFYLTDFCLFVFSHCSYDNFHQKKKTTHSR